MRTSAILLALTLGTSCFVGGTFAKYVTQEEGNDQARVAKWGVQVNVTGDGFKTSYQRNDGNSKVEGDTVVSCTGEKVVAPGTKGTFGGIKISGTPEVAVKIQTTANVDLSGWNVGQDGEFYCPLKFTVGNMSINGLDYSKTTSGGENSFEAKIKEAIEEATTKEVEAGTDLNEIGDGITYSWEWPFENASGTAAQQTDELDTLLGNNAADQDPNNDPKIDITVTTTVTQID